MLDNELRVGGKESRVDGDRGGVCGGCVGESCDGGSYDDMIAMPGWCTEERGKIAKSWSLAKQVEVLAGRIDAAWLEAHGRVDAEGTARVLAWLDEIIERAGTRGRVRMEFEETGLAAELRWAEVDGVRVGWRANGERARGTYR